MYLTFDATGVTGAENPKVDLTGVIENDDAVLCEDTLYSSLVMRLSKWALDKGVSFDSLYPLYIHDGEYWDDNAPKLDAGPDDEGWLKEIAQFAWFAHDDGNYVDSDQLFAVVDGIGWKWVDFDDLRNAVEDDYHTEFRGDYGEFAKEWNSEFESDPVPDHISHYVDWEAYGESLVDEYASYEWNDRTFLYNQ